MGASSRYSKKIKFLHLKDSLRPKLVSKGQYKQVLKNLSDAYETYNPSSLGEGVNQRPVDDESLLPLTRLAELATIKSQKVATKPHASLTLPPTTGRRYKKRQRGVR